MFQVQLFMTDFESTTMNVIDKFFLILKNGCLFHFNQFLWRQVVNSQRVMFLSTKWNILVEKWHSKTNGSSICSDKWGRRNIWRYCRVIDDEVVPIASYLEETYIREHWLLCRGRLFLPDFQKKQMINRNP